MKQALVALAISLSFFAAPAIAVHAATSPSLQDEITTTKTGLKGSLNLFTPVAKQAGFPEGAVPPEVIIGQLIKSLIVLMGVIFGVLMVYAGFLWMTARGTEDQIKKSKNILESATIGLVIVVAAYAITTFVVDRVINSAFQSSTSAPQQAQSVAPTNTPAAAATAPPTAPTAPSQPACPPGCNLSDGLGLCVSNTDGALCP